VKDNPLLVVIVLAVLAAITVVLSGHAVDGAQLLTALFGLMALAGGGHLANMPDKTGDVSPNAPPPSGGQPATPTQL
jgi:hypothetical protein